jgi:hypothetical protein
LSELRLLIVIVTLLMVYSPAGGKWFLQEKSLVFGVQALPAQATGSVAAVRDFDWSTAEIVVR